MTPRRAIVQVAGREVAVRIRNTAFLVITGVLVLAIVGGGLVMGVLADRDTEPHVVGLTEETARLEAALRGAAASTGAAVIPDVVGVADGEAALRAGEMSALIEGDPADPTVVVLDQVDPNLDVLLTVLWQQLALDREITALGGDPARVAQSVATATPTVRSLEPSEPVDGGRATVGLLGGVLIFIALTTTGQLVAQGVVEEKTSRVVELLLSTIRPWELMAGKVLGIGAVGLLQLALVLGAGAATAAATDALAGTGIDLTATVAWIAVWFVLGYTMYSLVLAATAALVSRQEDVGSLIAPVIVLMMIPYFIGVTVGLQNPDDPLVRTLSYVPLFSPILMPIRIATGVAQAWEMVLTAGVALALVPVLVWLAGRIYGNAVLRTGARVSLRSAFTGR